jgi:hypothetical protein
MNIKQVVVDGIGTVSIVRNRQATRFKIAVKPDGTVRVTIPWLAPIRSGEQFLSEHLQWIGQTKDKLAKRVVVVKLIQPGHLFSTRNYHYHVGTAEVQLPRIRFNKNEQQVFFEYPVAHLVGSPELQNTLLGMIENVLRFDAKRYLPGRITELAKGLGYSFQKVTIKNNKTNWGSCSNRKNINLNLHLMRLNDRLIDFVLVHELVHTVIPNHGPQFKATMKKHFHDADEMDKELKKIKTGIYSASDM